jgi:transposase
MIAFSPNAKFYLYQEAISMHCSFEGLSAAVQKLFSVEITSGAYFIFVNHRRDKMKILYWDNDGLAIWYKRLEKGGFSKKLFENKNLIDRREFFMLLEGIVPKRVEKRFNVS